MDKQSNFSHQQLVDDSADTFTSNPDVTMLLATSHDGAYYRPEARSYAEHEARKHNSEVVEINLLVVTEPEYDGPIVTEAGMVTISITEYHSLIDMSCAYLKLLEDAKKPADKVALAPSLAPAGLAELVAGATHFQFPALEPAAAEAAAPKTKASHKATTPKADSAK